MPNDIIITDDFKREYERIQECINDGIGEYVEDIRSSEITEGNLRNNVLSIYSLVKDYKDNLHDLIDMSSVRYIKGWQGRAIIEEDSISVVIAMDYKKYNRDEPLTIYFEDVFVAEVHTGSRERLRSSYENVTSDVLFEIAEMKRKENTE